MVGVGECKGKKDDNGIGMVIDFVFFNVWLVLGVGGVVMLGIVMLVVKWMYDWVISVFISFICLSYLGKRSWEELNWMGFF